MTTGRICEIRFLQTFGRDDAVCGTVPFPFLPAETCGTESGLRHGPQTGRPKIKKINEINKVNNKIKIGH